MPVQREKVVRAAEKLVSRGRIDAAIREYRKVLDDQPDDATTLNRVGDLYARTDRIDEAIRLFSQIAEGYTADGFFVKAIAIYKKIIKLDPTRLEVYERLAGLYHRQGLLNEARTQYQVLADYYQKHDDAASAIGIYERMAVIDPEDPAPRVKLAELYGEQELIDKAMGEYRRIAELMLGHGRVEQAEQVYRRALEVSADDLGFVTDAVLELKQAGHLAAATRLLTFAVELNPKAAGVARMSRLGAARAGGATEVAEGLPAGAAESEAAEDDAAAAAEPTAEPTAEAAAAVAAVADEAVSAEPAATAEELGEEEAPALDASLRGDAAAGVEEPDAAEETAPRAGAEETGVDLVLDLDAPLGPDDTFDLGSELDLAEEVRRAGAELEAARADGAPLAEDAEEVDLEAEPAAAAPVAADRARKVEIDEAFLERTASELVPEQVRQEDDLITEAEVLAKYGLADKASERLGELLELNPRHPGALRLHVQLLVEAGRADEAISAADRLRETVGEGSAVWAETALRLENAGYAVDAGRIAPPVEEVVDEAADETAEEIELALDVATPAPAAEVEAAAELEAAEPEPPPATPEASEPPVSPPDRVRRVEREVESLLEEIADALVPGRRKRKLAAAEAAEARPAAEAAPAPAEPASAEPPPAEAVEPPPAEAAADVFPGTEGSDWLEAVDAGPAAAGVDGGAVFDQEEDFFDLAAEIEEELAREGALDDEDLLLEPPREQSLEEIVEGFKKGVAEVLSPEDYATHLDLGIAYREMGLLDEAIGEFQIAAKAPDQLVQCCSMLGLSFLDKGLPELAIKWYKRGLAAPDLSEDDQLGLLYDLGNAYFATGEREEAYRVFVDLYGTNSNYRDVVAKVAETAPPGR